MQKAQAFRFIVVVSLFVVFIASPVFDDGFGLRAEPSDASQPSASYESAADGVEQWIDPGPRFDIIEEEAEFESYDAATFYLIGVDPQQGVNLGALQQLASDLSGGLIRLDMSHRGSITIKDAVFTYDHGGATVVKHVVLRVETSTEQ